MSRTQCILEGEMPDYPLLYVKTCVSDPMGITARIPPQKVLTLPWFTPVSVSSCSVA